MRVQELKHNIYKTKDLPTLPIVAQQIMSAANKQQGSFRALSSVVEQDPSLTIKLLGLANGALYGQQAQVSSVHRAISVVGAEMLERLALCAFVKDSWAHNPQREHFWKHSIAVAFGTSFLSQQYEVVSPDDAFCAGLLHDVGVLVLDTVVPEAYEQVERRLRIVARVSREETEQDLLGVDHTQAGAWFADRWQLPRMLTEGIAGHHSGGEGSIPGMIRVAEQAALSVELGLYGELDEAPTEQQIEVEAFLRSKAKEIDKLFRTASKGP